jgi:hypothetical protein
MLFNSVRSDLLSARDQAQTFLTESRRKPRVVSSENLSVFGTELRYAFLLLKTEKEIIFFAALQWLAIVVAYLCWVPMLDWIPDSLWNEAIAAHEQNREEAFTLINLALLGWSFLIVVMVSYPLSLLNAAITVAHYLRQSGQESTVGRCLGLAFHNLGKLWLFTAVDAWITVTAIADRLPRKRGRRTAVDELLYYAWKIGTVGVLPALAAGKGFGQAAQESFLLLKQEPKRVIGIRMGYSLLCWIIGVVTYVAAILYFVKFGDFRSQANQIYDFYVLMALPLLLSVGVIMVMIRPFYLIMIANVYTGVAEVALPLNATQSEARGAQLINLVALFFSSFFAVLIALTLLGDDTGLQAWIESLAQQDLKALGRGR